MIIALIYNLSLLISLSVFSGFIDKYWSRNTLKGKILQGILFGIVAAIGMLKPYIFSEGLIFDGRSVILSLCGLFFGPIPSIFALLITIPLRIYQGGLGVYMGISVAFISGAVGSLFYYYRHNHSNNNKFFTNLTVLNLYLFGIIIHLLMLLMTILLPSSIRYETLTNIALPVMLLYPFATVLISKILKDQESNQIYLSQLKESEERLNYAIENAGDGLWDWDLTTNNVFYSARWKEFLGYKANELDNTIITWENTIFQDDLEKCKESMNSYLTGKTDSFNIEHRLVTKNNSILWVLARGKIIEYHENIRPIRFIGTQVNITERKNYEKTLKENEEMFRLITDNAFDIIVLVDLKSKFKYVNAAYEAILGYNQNDLIDRTPLEFSHPDDFSSIFTLFEQAYLNKTHNFHFIAKVRTKDGVYKSLDHRVSQVFNDAGEPYLYLILAQDITERLNSEFQLMLQKEAMESAIDGMAILDENFRFIYINPSFLEVNKYLNIDELLNQNFQILYGNSEKELINSKLLKQFNTDRYWIGTIQAMKKDGTSYIQELQLKQLPNNFTSIVIRDISEQIEAEKELTNAKIKAEESDKLKSAFLSNMSHELRTPLNSICGFSDILKQSEILDEDQLNYVNIINTNSVQLLRLINDIVDISKIESGLNNVNKTKFNIIELIQEVANSYDELLAVKKLRLKTICNYDHEMSMVVSDYDKIKTIIGNILRNAIKFSNKGTIEIGIKFEELTYTIQIKDEGIGIDNKYLDVIFHRFRQGDIGSHMSRQGLGLGLSISKALIELLGGKIWVESSLGLGSTFYFTLPRTK